jgi:uncharacterized membrane protein HdeD (DUF308 family)
MELPSTPLDSRPTAPKRAWVWMAVLAATLIVLGLVAMSALAFGAKLLIVVLGWLLIGAGALQIGGAFFYHGFGGLGAEILFGLLGIVLGVVLISNPALAGGLLALVIVAGLIADAVLEGVRAATARRQGWIWPVLIALLAAALGIAIMINPGLLLALLGFLVGVNLLVRGVTMLLAALEVRKLSQ